MKSARHDLAANHSSVEADRVSPLGDFEGFFRDHYASVARSARLLVGDADLGREIAQEAFVRTYLRWSRLTSTEHARAFVYKVALNLARSELRRARRLELGREPATPDSAQDEVSSADERIIVHKLLATLTTRQRACLVLIDYVGFNSTEAARVLHMRPSTVRVQLSRARARLAEALREQE